MSELRLALRRLRRRPGRSLIAVVTLGLGIGASTAAFSAVEDVLLTPLPIDAPERVVVVWHENPMRGGAHVPFRPDAVEAVADAPGALAAVAAFQTVGAQPAIVEAGGAAHAVRQVGVSGDFFGVLGAGPALGRLLTASDDALGAEPTVVVSHGFFVRALGADTARLGSVLRFRDRSVRLVGVTEPGFDLPRGTEAWTTLRAMYPEWAERPPIVELDMIARLAAGAGPEEASATVRAALADDPAFSGVYRGLEPVVTPMHDYVVGSFEAVLEAGMAASLLLLVVAVANATLLFLSGGARAVQEVAARQALGAGRARVVRPALADAAVLAAAGAALGVGLGWLTVEGLLPWAPPELPRLDRVSLDASSVVFAVAVAGVATLASGGLAGLWLSRGDPREALVSGGRGGLGGERLRRVIAAVQVSLAVVAAVGAGLLVRTVDNLGALDRGFDAEGLWLARLDHGHRLFEVPDEYVEQLGAVSAALVARPGIMGATPTLNQPLDFSAGIEMAPTLEGQGPEEARANPYVSLDAVLPGHFAVLGMSLRGGRLLDPGDAAGAPRVVLVNEAAARALWPGRSALGQRLQIYPGEQDAWGEVVGVVADTRLRSFPEARPAAWVPLAQYRSIPPGRLLVRAEAEVDVRDAVAGVLTEHAPGVRVQTVDAVEELLGGPLLVPRFARAVLLTFAGFTLLLTGLGIYGVFAVLVQERRQELGLRKALGARGGDLVRFVAVRVLRVGGAGAAVGLLLSLWLTGWIESLLFGVAATDALTLGGVLAGTLSVALLAALVPALRAARADPARILHTE